MGENGPAELRQDDMALFDAALLAFLRGSGRLALLSILGEASNLYHRLLHVAGAEAVRPLYGKLKELRPSLITQDHVDVWESARNAALVDTAGYHCNVGEWEQALALLEKYDRLVALLDGRQAKPRTDLRARRLAILADICALGPRGITDRFGSPQSLIAHYPQLLAQLERSHAVRWQAADEPERLRLARSRSLALDVLAWAGAHCACVAWRYAQPAVCDVAAHFRRGHGADLFEPPTGGALRPPCLWFETFRLYHGGEYSRAEAETCCESIRDSIHSSSGLGWESASVLRGVTFFEKFMLNRHAAKAARRLDLKLEGVA